MQAASRWARGAVLGVTIDIGWSHVRERKDWRWQAKATSITRPYVKGDWGPYAEPRVAWIARLLTDGLSALERLAARGVDPVGPLKILALIEDQRPARQRQAALLADTVRLRRDAAAIERGEAALRRHPRLADKAPLAEVLYEGKPYGRSLYAWHLEFGDYAAAVLRAVAPRSTGKPQERESRVAALALTRAGANKREVGELLGAAGLGYRTADGTAKLLKRARDTRPDVAAADRVLASVRLVSAVPKNVPAATRNRPQTTPRQPTKKKKTPR